MLQWSVGLAIWPRDESDITTGEQSDRLFRAYWKPPKILTPSSFDAVAADRSPAGIP